MNAKHTAGPWHVDGVLKAIREHYRNEMSQGYRDFVDAAIRKAEGANHE